MNWALFIYRKIDFSFHSTKANLFHKIDCSYGGPKLLRLFRNFKIKGITSSYCLLI